MENDENLIEVEKLKYRPFTRFCMSIGAVPSSYLASMTMPEQILWLSSYLQNEVIPTVNNNGEAVEELQNLFVELKNYVDDYFENLDVQEEINNKLDSMAESGELENLIGAYIQPRIDAQNLRIDGQDLEIANFKSEVASDISDMESSLDSSLSNFQIQINSVASGSPAGVYATTSALSTADPDHSKIYLVTEDNKWYYYNSSLSSWVAGGTYNASDDYTDINNRLVVDEDNIANLMEKANLQLYLDYESGRIDAQGVDQPQAGLYRTKNYIKIDKKAQYKFIGKNGNGTSIRIYDSSKTFVRTINLSSVPTGEAVQFYTFNQSNDYYFRLSLTAYQNDIETYPVSTSNIEVSIINGYYNTTETDFNSLPMGNTYISNTSGTLTNAPFTSGKYVVMTIPMNRYVILQIATLQGKLVYPNSDTRYNHLGTYYRMFNPENTSQTYVRWSTIDKPLKSQDKYVAFGDSITHGYIKTQNGTTVITDYPYPQTVGNLLSLTPYEGANTGSGYIALQNNRNACTIIDAYDFTNVNMVTLAFGTNDWNGNVPLGTINDTTSSPTTIYGGIKHCIETISTANPLTTIVLITPINRSQVGSSGSGELTYENNYAYGTDNSAGYSLGDVCDAIVDCAKFYGLSYIDNRDGCPINRLNLSSTLEDGLHPNDNGYIKYGQHIASKLNGLFIPYHF